MIPAPPELSAPPPGEDDGEEQYGDLTVYRRWRTDPDLHRQVADHAHYGPGELRTSGYLYQEGELPWPPDLAKVGGELLDSLRRLLGVRFPIVAMQGYRDGAGTGWHTDSPFHIQAVLSLGVTRQFGIRRRHFGPVWIPVHDGDLVFMPAGFQTNWEHSVLEDATAGERISLVFRTPVRS